MKRIQYQSYGGPEVLHLEEFSLRAVGPNEISVQVKAASFNPMDRKIRNGELKMITGRKFPRGLGHDFAGVVRAIGSEVTRFKVGDEVFGATALKEAGTFAEALVANQKGVLLKPQNLSFVEAATLPVVCAAAWTALIDKARLRAGQQVLITGCLGATGRAAVQLAKMRGAEVTGSCHGDRRREAETLGVHEVIDYRTFEPDNYLGRFDVVFDVHGGLTLRQCSGMLKRGGVALHLVPTPLKMLWGLLSPRHKTIFTNVTPKTLAGIVDAVEKGILTPRVGQVVGLSEAIPAIVDAGQSSLPSGKLVVVSHT